MGDDALLLQGGLTTAIRLEVNTKTDPFADATEATFSDGGTVLLLGILGVI